MERALARARQRDDAFVPSTARAFHGEGEMASPRMVGKAFRGRFSSRTFDRILRLSRLTSPRLPSGLFRRQPTGRPGPL